jgi:hypothetical protein
MGERVAFEPRGRGGGALEGPRGSAHLPMTCSSCLGYLSPKGGHAKASCKLPQDGSTAVAEQGQRIGRERRHPMMAERCGGAPPMQELSTGAS